MAVRVRFRVRVRGRIRVRVRISVRVRVGVRLELGLGHWVGTRLRGGESGFSYNLTRQESMCRLCMLYAMHPCQHHSSSSSTFITTAL